MTRKIRANRRVSAFAVFMLLAALVAPCLHFTDARAFNDTVTLGRSYRQGTYISTPVKTDGETALWVGTTTRSNGDMVPTVIGADFADPEPFVVGRIGPTYPDLERFDIDAGLAVWIGTEFDADTPLEHESIIARQLPDGEPFVVTDIPDRGVERFVGGPAVWGDWIVWMTRNPTNTNTLVKARNIAEMTEPIVLADRMGADGDIGALQVDDGWVAWGEEWDRDQNAFSQIRVLRIDSRTDEVIIDAAAVANHGTFTLAEGQVAYASIPTVERPADPKTGVSATTVVDLETGTVRVAMIVAHDPDAVPGLYPTPAMAFDGRYIYQAFMINIITPSNGSFELVMAYDLETNSSFPVIRNMLRDILHADNGALAWIVTGDWAVAARIEDGLPTASVADAREPGSTDAWFPETGHHLGGTFKAFWDGSGGLPVFGYSLTEPYSEQNDDTGDFYTVQWFERQRYELHPENAGTPYEVLLGRLGVELLAAQGRDWTTFPQADPSSADYFPETGQAIAPEFASYWSSHGLELGDEGLSFRESVALFGYPISPAMTETNVDGDTVLTQYFERAVIEYHPENAGTQYEVLLRRVGAEALKTRGWYR